MILIVGALLGAFAVGFGAYAEHGLKAHLEPEIFGTLETALRYNLIHAGVIVGIGVSQRGEGSFARSKLLWLAGLGFSIGVLVFCFSIYLSALLAMPELTSFAPFGGSTLIVSWLMLALAGIYHRAK